MIRVVRRTQLLTVLVLLLSGLLQSLASSQGVTCARSHAPADAAQQARGSTTDGDGEAAVVAHRHAIEGDHHHSRGAQPDARQAPAAPCGTAAVPAERSALPHTVVARRLLPPGDQPPASLLIRSLFRPPRLS